MRKTKPDAVVIAVPTSFEAEELARQLGIERVKLSPGRLIEFSANKFLSITGVSKKIIAAIDAIYKTFKDRGKFKDGAGALKIILIGFCGSNDKSRPIGKAFVITKAAHADRTITLEDEAAFLAGTERACIATLNNYGSGPLVDMESFWAADRCAQLGLTLRIVRIVSDHCDMDPKTAANVFKFRDKNVPNNLKKAQIVLSNMSPKLTI